MNDICDVANTMNVRVLKLGRIRTGARSAEHYHKAMKPSRKAIRRRLKATALQEMPHLRSTKNEKLLPSVCPDVVPNECMDPNVK
jgi:hypothetical protein